MLDHVSITVPDIAAVRSFYDAVMQALGYPCVYVKDGAVGYGLRARPDAPGRSYISILQSPAMQPDPRRHWCFKAASHEQVRAFYAAALQAGGRDDGPPGPRPHYHDRYYAAFVIDPAGNRIEAACHV
ncbi:VOC family protein [Ferrovibrio sp.]|jgi:catechol 2,3-dioxygenase-like lactoylglutathione lyase family enzyme|uniref:VOC family protein n=2 Tax=Ferrovibrio sp. TaxID=1917215 RepID=UPI0035B4E46B